jgi:hypothetical protein
VREISNILLCQSEFPDDYTRLTDALSVLLTPHGVKALHAALRPQRRTTSQH